MRRSVAVLALCALAGALISTGCIRWPEPKASPRVVGLLGGQAAVDIIEKRAGVTAVQAWRIDGSLGARADGASDVPSLHGYPVLSGPVPVDDAAQAGLAGVLTEDVTYLWDVAKACEFLPGVLVRWSGGAAEVDVLLCFSCDELEVYLDGEKTGHEDFDPRRGDLVRISKRLFPDDPAIRSLEE